MKIALIGGTGFVGSAILKEALNRGQQVTAVLRHAEKLSIKDKNLKVIPGNVMDTEKLSELIKGNDAVVSAYNPGWSNPDIYNEFLKGSLSIQAAVKKSGIKRLITLGGAGSSYIAPNLQLIDTPEFPAEWKAGALAARDYLNILRKEDELD